jgi:hypothetical protein
MIYYHKPIRIEFAQRAFDGKWQKLGLFIDRGNAYTYPSESGTPITYIPETWLTMAVYDYELEILP